MLAMNSPPALLLASFFVFPLLAFSSYCPTNCSNIPKISYPFGAATGCGLPDFQLDCSFSLAKWNLRLNSSKDPTPYAVKGIDNQQSYGAVNLTWFMNSTTADSDSICVENFFVNDSNMNYSLFGGTNLSGFMGANLTFSESNIYLLLGCENLPEEILDAQDCSHFETSCPNDIEKCVVFNPTPGNYIEPDLRKQFEEYNCTRYTSVLTSEPANVSSADSSSAFLLGIQLNWTQPRFNSKCSACQSSKGTCGYNIAKETFLCFCDNGSATETDCSQIGPRCVGHLCTTPAKVLVLGVTPTIGLASIALVIVYFVRRRRTKSRGSVRGGSSHKFVTERGKSFATQFGPVSAREYSFKELEHATESFSDDKLLGDGGFGAVYEGRLHDDRKVAVKRLYHDNFRRMDQFYNEIRILSSLQHSNLVKLYGYCCEDERDLLLVFEYVSNGTVADHVHNPDAEALPWKIRLKIALETAEALSYLHNDMSPPIYHRDVKSTNILLEQDFHVKLADFGLSRLVPLQATHVSTLPQGTPGYLDPDYHQSYQLTDKSDVYSFGVVLMELISALPAVDMSRSRGEINLSSLAVSKIVCGAWQELVDSRLQIDHEPHVEAMVRSVAELAFRCLDSEKENRPTMEEVAKELANIRECGYGDLNSQSSINISLCTKETSRLINPKVAPSPTSVRSPWLSSNSSSDSTSYLLHSRSSAP